jgi:hypothetical protein
VTSSKVSTVSVHGGVPGEEMTGFARELILLYSVHVGLIDSLCQPTGTSSSHHAARACGALSQESVPGRSRCGRVGNPGSPAR